MQADSSTFIEKPFFNPSRREQLQHIPIVSSWKEISPAGWVDLRKITIKGLIEIP